MRGQPDMTAPPVATSSFLATRRGRIVLVFLCAVGFLDFLDTSIVNVALPSIQRDLHFSTQNLQWVVSGYIVTYGGFLLLGGRVADLVGRRRTLVAGTALFGLASLAGGLAPNAGTLVGARLVQGLGAALMSPAALSILTTTFSNGTDRVKALGAWGAIAGISSAAGGFLGGELAGAVALLALFVVNETRVARPLVPLSIFRVPGLAAADATQVIALAGFYSAFFFVTLYMQDVLGFSAFRAGSAYVPVTVMVAVAAGAGSALITRIGTRPLIVSGALIASGGVFWLSQLPVHGSYWTNLFPGLMIMGFGLGGVFVGVQTAANAGVPPSLAGLAGALVTASTQVGAALGLAIFSAVATAHTSSLLAAGASTPVALTGGFHRALLLASIFILCSAVIALRAANTRGEPSSAEITGVAVAAEDGPNRVRAPRPSPEQ